MLDSDSPWRRDLFALLRLTGPVAAARLGVMAMGLSGAVLAVILASLVSAALLLGRFWMLDRPAGRC